MKQFLADLHIHTALSPCAAAEMTPRAIVEAARGKGLAVIAVCDHNTAGNVVAAQQAAGDLAADAAQGGADTPAVLAGMEITTAEEAHILGLFPDVRAAEAAAEEVLATLPPAPADDSRFGEQLLLTADGRVRGKEPKMLAAASAFGLSEAVALVHRHGGLAVASHVDRPSFSVTSQLGLFPSEAGLDAIEISALARDSPMVAGFEALGLPVITSSDSHSLGEIGCAATVLTMRAATFAEMALAFRGAEGRGVHRA